MINPKGTTTKLYPMKLTSGFSDRVKSMIPYFGLVHPLLEQMHWRPLRESTAWSHPIFAGYHMLVLSSLLSWPWLLLCFVVLLTGSLFWRQVVRATSSLTVPVLSHVIADPSDLFQFGAVRKVTDMSNAEVGRWLDGIGEHQNLAQVFSVNDAYPADPEALGACGDGRTGRSARGLNILPRFGGDALFQVVFLRCYFRDQICKLTERLRCIATRNRQMEHGRLVGL